MKNLVLTFAILLSSVALNEAYSNNDTPKRTFEIKCVMKSYEKKLKKAEVKIYREGSLLEKIETNNGKFNIKLPPGGDYLLEFSSDEHHTKRIGFNTELDYKDTEVPGLDLTMTLMPSIYEHLPEEDMDLLEFPVAYIGFNERSKSYYDINSKYSDVLIKNIELKSKIFMEELNANRD